MSGTAAKLFLPVLFAAAGALMLAFAAATVHHRSGDDVAADSGAARSQQAFAHWRQHGYLRSGGVAVRRGPDGSPSFHRSSAGGRLLSGYLVARATAAIVEREGWRVVALHNQLIVMVAAVLLGLLGVQVARALDVPLFHAGLLGLSLQGVFFTFPDNLALYWEISGREWFVLFAAGFLLLELRRRDGGGRAVAAGQAVAVFLMTWMEFKTGVAFGLSYLLATVILARERTTPARLAVVIVLPLVLALGVIAGQLAIARAQFPDIPVEGSAFLVRSGLDGSPAHYADHLDIAFGRDVARRNFPHAGDWLFRWSWLFAAGTAALAGMLVAAARGGVPPAVLVGVVSLLGTYVLSAAVFSQAVAIHPYLYDVLLFTPLALVLLVVAPSLLEARTGHRGVVVLLVVFLAIWMAMVQARRFALWYPTARSAVSGRAG